MFLNVWDSHPISALRGSLDSIKATLRVCGEFSSPWPQYNTISPVSNLFCPHWVQCVPVIPRTDMLYLLISTAIWLVLSISHIARTSHAPILSVVPVIRRGIGLVAFEESRLSTWVVIIVLSDDLWTQRTEFKWFNLFILFNYVLAGLFSTILVLLTLIPTLLLYQVLGPSVTVEGPHEELLNILPFIRRPYPLKLNTNHLSLDVESVF